MGELGSQGAIFSFEESQHSPRVSLQYLTKMEDLDLLSLGLFRNGERGCKPGNQPSAFL